jgi:CheY-like chemotaxis protein
VVADFRSARCRRAPHFERLDLWRGQVVANSADMVWRGVDRDCDLIVYVTNNRQNWDRCCRIEDPVGAFNLQGTGRHSTATIGPLAGSCVSLMAHLATQRPVVLIVDDEALVRASAVDWVGEAGFEAVEAADADEAIRILESRDDIRVVFTDINIQGSMDGLRLAHAVRNRWPLIKLVVTSGRRLPAKTDLPDGGRFLAKPYGPAQVATFWELIA